MRNKEKIIKYRQYLNFFTEQNFYIWNEFNESQLLFEQTKEKKEIDNFNFFNEDDENSEEENIHIWWSKAESEYLKTLNNNDKATKIWTLIEDQLFEYIKEITKCDNNSIFICKKSDSLDVKKEYLKQSLADPKIQLIINPTFSYTTENGFEVVSTFFAYDKGENTAYFNSFDANTKIKDYFEADFIFNVFKRAQKKRLKDIKKIIFDNNTKTFANKISFCTTQAAAVTKSPSGNESIYILNNEEIVCKDIFKKGYSFCHPDVKKMTREDKRIEVLTFLDVIQKRHLFKNPNYDKTLEAFIFNKKDLFDDTLPLGKFDQNIEKIEKQFYVEQDKPIFENIYTDDNYSSNFYWNPNPKYIENNRIKAYFLNKLGHDFWFSSGYLTAKLPNSLIGTSKRSKMYDEVNFQQWKKIINFERKTTNFFTTNVFYLFSKLHKKNQRIIWYDYEGFSLPTPILDDTKHYQQLTHQVSIIETYNGKIVNSKDIVKDPAHLRLIDLVDNIIDVYSNGANYYVVYNQSYENSRNKELLKLVIQRLQAQDQEFISEFNKRNLDLNRFKEMINHINNNTIDLNFWFKPVSEKVYAEIQEYKKEFTNADQFLNQDIYVNFNNQTINDTQRNADVQFTFYDPVNKKMFGEENTQRDVAFATKKNGHFFRIFELRGMSSIKKIEKLITIYDIKLKHSIFPYKELEIQNGMYALEKAVNRHQGLIGDNDWKHIEHELKKYCHNDVMAMIVAYDFAQKIVADVFPEFNNYEWKLEENQYYGLDFEKGKIVILNKNI